ncbi:MAG: AAA domain-containing protein [Bacteroidales bacterium]|nr:AAA domain-containing protein [Bacteroidales bacterium]
MKLTEDKLRYLWRMRDTIFNDESNKEIIARFKWVNDLFNEIESKSVEYNQFDIGTEVYLDGKKILKMNGENPNDSYFACEEDEMAAQGAFNGVYNMANSYSEYKYLIENIGCLLGGFDEHKVMHEEYRIVSNTIKEGHERNSLCSVGQSRHPSSNFADNNYFFNVIDAINKIKEDKFNPNQSKVVLRYPHETYYGSHNREGFWIEAEEDQKNALVKRFPYKYFYMWTHRNEVIHLVGLKSYRNLVWQNELMAWAYADQEMNQSFNDFISDSGWRSYSESLKELIPIEERGDEVNFVSDLSMLLSIVLSQPVELKNMLDLLNSGNHAIVLYGPPGTGKTYSAKQLVSNKLGIPYDKIDDYKFKEGGNISFGTWDIVQFHPNYSYEDFIGGISPRLDGEDLVYQLKEGIFKKLCDVANKPENSDKPFVLIIDEINRADLSTVFGELMYALEYRGEEISIPNFNFGFIIPKNVYIIGTMNSVDKSLVTFDLALRRRFGFFKIMPDVKILPQILSKVNVSENSMTNFVKRCQELNDYISKSDNLLNLGADYQIGHAYFAKIKDFLQAKEGGEEVEISSFDLEKLWIYHLEPLIEEYLGDRIDDPNIQDEVKSLKTQFISELGREDE